MCLPWSNKIRFPWSKSYIRYHGTTWENARTIQHQGFIPSRDGPLGRGVYLSHDLEKAAQYPIKCEPEMRAVLKVKVRVGKVKIIVHPGDPQRKTWFQQGYNTAFGIEEDCVFNPGRIKVLEFIENQSHEFRTI